MKVWVGILVVTVGVSLGLWACGDDTSCDSGEQRCVGMQIQTCGDAGAWGEAQACETGHCMAMDNGVEHCMAM